MVPANAIIIDASVGLYHICLEVPPAQALKGHTTNLSKHALLRFHFCVGVSNMLI